MKKYWRGVGVVVVVVSVLAIGLIYSQDSNGTFLKINGKNINLEVADSSAEREQGLSGREQMSQNKGMLFVFGKPGQQCMWMKDMNFNIDLIWADEDKQIVHLEQNVPPESYPKSFCPPKNAKYVIELSSGQIESLGIAKGTKLNF